jgi:Tol biopolymer transport system component
MTKTKEWMGQIRRVSPPELWEEVERRALHGGPDPTEPRSRAQAAVILITSVLVIGSIIYALHDIGRASRPLVTGGERNGSIAFVQTHHLGKGPWRIELLDPATGKTTDLTHIPGSFGDPTWSPEGAKLAYTVTRQAVSTIHVMAADGSDERLLVPCSPPECLSVSSPTWSPDGSSIAFARSSGGGAVVPEAIFTTDPVNAAATKLVNLPGLAFVTQLAWSPNGDRILFAASPTGPAKYMSVYEVDANGSGLRRLTSLGGQNAEPAWSPDGSKIVFVHDSALFVMNADGSDAHELHSCTPDCVSAYEPAWSPDGTEIAFSQQFDNERDLFMMRADGTNVRRLTRTPADEFQPAWQPLPTHPSPAPSVTSGSSSDGVSIAVPRGWVFRGYREPTDATNPKIPLALGTWPFPDRVILHGPIPKGQILIDIEESAPPYAPGFPKPREKDVPAEPRRFALPATPNSGLPFARGRSYAYLVSFRAAGRVFEVRISVAEPLSSKMRRKVDAILSTITVAPASS